jgi:hypothetical protein
MKIQTILFILAFVILAVQGPNYPYLDQNTTTSEHDCQSHIEVFPNGSGFWADDSGNDDDGDDDDLDRFEILNSKQRR